MCVSKCVWLPSTPTLNHVVLVSIPCCVSLTHSVLSLDVLTRGSLDARGSVVCRVWLRQVIESARKVRWSLQGSVTLQLTQCLGCGLDVQSFVRGFRNALVMYLLSVSSPKDLVELLPCKSMSIRGAGLSFPGDKWLGVKLIPHIRPVQGLRMREP